MDRIKKELISRAAVLVHITTHPNSSLIFFIKDKDMNKNTKFRRPKKPSVRSYKIFINQFIDNFDWGMKKKHFFCSHRPLLYQQTKKDTINALTPQRRQRYSLKEEYVKYHLEDNYPESYLYYTNSQRSKTPLFCIDIDVLPHTTSTDIDNCISFLLSLHPDSYYEYSSNGKGIHFYLLLDLRNTDLAAAARAEYANDLMSGYVIALQVWLNSLYNIKVDTVKATYTTWKYNKKKAFSMGSKAQSKLFKGLYEIDTCGALCKLPCPQSPESYEKLFNIPFTTVSDIITNAKYVLSLINDFKNGYLSTISSGTFFPLFSLFNDFNSLLYSDIKKGVLTILPINFDNNNHNTLYNINNKTKHSHNPLSSTNPISLTTYNSMLPAGNLYNNNMGVSGWDEMQLEDYRLIEDAFERTHLWGKKYLRVYYKKYNTLPSCEEFRKEYRQCAGTGKEDNSSRDRLIHCYNYLIKNFDENKINHGYTVGEFIENIKQYITQEKINKWMSDNKPKMKNKILLEDLDVGLGYYFSYLMKEKQKRKKAKRSFAVGIMGMKKWFKYLKETGQYDRSCNSSRAMAIRDILLDVKLIQCVDDTYQFSGSKNGIAQRFILTEKCTRYREFERYYGKEFINQFTQEHRAEAG